MQSVNFAHFMYSFAPLTIFEFKTVNTTELQQFIDVCAEIN